MVGFGCGQRVCGRWHCLLVDGHMARTVGLAPILAPRIQRNVRSVTTTHHGPLARRNWLAALDEARGGLQITALQTILPLGHDKLLHDHDPTMPDLRGSAQQLARTRDPGAVRDIPVPG